MCEYDRKSFGQKLMQLERFDAVGLGTIQSSIRDQEPSKRDRKGPNEIPKPDSQNWITSLTSAGWIVARRRPAPHPAPLGHMHLEFNPDVDVRGSVRWISIKRRLSNQKGNVMGFNPVRLRSHAWAFTFCFARGLTFIFIAFLLNPSVLAKSDEKVV